MKTIFERKISNLENRVNVFDKLFFNPISNGVNGVKFSYHYYKFLQSTWKELNTFFSNDMSKEYKTKINDLIERVKSFDGLHPFIDKSLDSIDAFIVIDYNKDLPYFNEKPYFMWFVCEEIGYSQIPKKEKFDNSNIQIIGTQPIKTSKIHEINIQKVNESETILYFLTNWDFIDGYNFSINYYFRNSELVKVSYGGLDSKNHKQIKYEESVDLLDQFSINPLQIKTYIKNSNLPSSFKDSVNGITKKSNK